MTDHTQSHSIKEVRESIFLWDPTHANPPESLPINGRTLYRFMDYIYLYKEHLEDLTQSEVHNLCHVRSEFPQTIGAINSKVREIFHRFISSILNGKGRSFEIGAGNNPLNLSSGSDEIHCLDSDSDQEVLSNREAACVFSGTEAKLSYADNYFDIIFAIFVFQFKIYHSQILEIHRCLSENGLLFVNVYRRTEESSAALKAEIESVQLHVQRIPDPLALCRRHEFWIISKKKNALEAHAQTLMEVLKSANQAYTSGE